MITSIQSWLRPARFLIVLATCALLVFSNAFPAVAAGYSSKTKPTEGEAQLDKILEKSEDAARSAPPSLEDVETQANQGINEVQGDADYNKMKRPENSQNAKSFTDQVKEALDNANPNK